MKFADIPGQSELKQALRLGFHKNKMAHAQLLAGVEGGAALPLAMAFIQFIFCENRSIEDSCGSCANCVRVQKGVHPDIHYFFPRPSFPKDQKDKKMGEALQSFRDFLQKTPYGLLSQLADSAGFADKNLLINKEDSKRIVQTVSMKAVEQKAKVLLIWMPEYFHPAAANAILKVLEEPPAHTLYFLVSHAYEGLLSTITSRTLLYNVPPFMPEEIADQLKEKGMEADKALQASKMAHGSLGVAMQAGEEADAMAYQAFREWMLHCLNNHFDKLLLASEGFAALGKQQQKSSLEFALNILREALIADQPILRSRNGDEANFVKKFNSFLPFENKQKMYEELNQALYNLERNANAKMTHFHLSSVFSQLLQR